MKFLDWKYLNENQIAELEAASTEVQIKRLLFEFFEITKLDRKKQRILVLFHFNNYAFCKEIAFDARKTSTYMSMMNELLQLDTKSTDKANDATKSFQRFQTFLMQHSVEKPPVSIKIFKETEIEPIINRVIESYYKNYKLYNYIYGVQYRTTLSQSLPMGVEAPLQYGSLDDACELMVMN